METLNRDIIEKDYNKVKKEFQTKDNLLEAYNIANQMIGQEDVIKKVFTFLVFAFRGKLRNDKKTPLVFHSIYLTKMAYLCGEKNIDALLTTALHDVLEDTEINEESLMNESFMTNKEYLISHLKILSENKNLSREPNGENLPPRYVEHIKRIIGAPKEVINTEIIDRFSDLMDLEYITELPENERKFRLKSKLVKVKGFVYNIIQNRDDFNKNCLKLFEAKVRDTERTWNIKVDAPIITN